MENVSIFWVIKRTSKRGNLRDQAVPAFADFVPAIVVVNVDYSVVAHLGSDIRVLHKVINAAFELEESGIVQSGIGP